MGKTNKKIEKEIDKVLERLETMEMDAATKAKEIEHLKTLCELRNSNDTSKIDCIAKKVKMGTEVAAVIIPSIIYAVFLDRGFRFEEEGVYTSKTFNNLTGKIKP